MRRWRFAVVLSLVLAAAVLADEEPLNRDLVAGVKSGDLEVSGDGVGATRGECVFLTIANRSGRTLRVLFAPGTIVDPSQPGRARMVLAKLRGETVDNQTYRPVDDILLSPGQTRRYTFLAYSQSFEQRDATDAARFRVVGQDEGLGNLFKAAEARDASLDVTQAAVWFYMGGVTDRTLDRRMALPQADIGAAREIAKAAAEAL
jgi:hypothetical protein